jgi:hypothetical protein
MPRTIWFALFCVAVLGALMTIKIATTPSLLAVATPHDQTAMEVAFAPNAEAKSDRLPLPDIRQATESDPVPPLAMAVETPSSSPDTSDRATDESTRNTLDPSPRKVAHRRWQNSNAKLIADDPPRRHAKVRSEKTNADNNEHENTARNVFHCRQDALGTMLRSLDLSPRCRS